MIPALLDQWKNGQIGLLAAAPPGRLEVSPQYYYLGLAILCVLMVVALVKAYRMWEEIHDVEEPDSPTDLLETFEEARATGELNDEEFERVRQRLAGQGIDKDAASRSSIVDDQAPDGA